VDFHHLLPAGPPALPTPKTVESIGAQPLAVMPGLEPGIQAAPSADVHGIVGPGCTGQARA
jgi:hypothetical protein